jgi:hypothetical protein
VNSVVVGVGELDGRGVYAGQDFGAGDVVLGYDLRPLSREEFGDLAPVERMFVHSYAGRRYLYPAPARYVNHSDSPSAWADFDRGCYVAARRIRRGEAVTINALTETNRELSMFQNAYVAAVNRRDREVLGSLVDDDATFWLPTGASATTKLTVRESPATSWPPVLGDRYLVTDTRWIVAQHRWEALCSYNFEYADTTSAGRDTVRGHGSDLLKVIDGNWQLIYSHLSTTQADRARQVQEEDEPGRS